MESAFKKLSGGNGIAQGMKTSQTVATEQQAKPAAQQNQETFENMMHGNPTTPPKDEHEAAVRMNQATAKGLMNGTIKPVGTGQKPVEKNTEQSPIINQPKSYAEMFAELNKGMMEPPEQQKSREKKERTDAIVRSVGDGLSALSRMYFATKGAVTAHNPQNDLTASANKRREYLQQQREKNKAAWLTGYQRALALDEEARKNNMTAAEAFRYHNMLNSNKERVADQGDRRLDQGDARLEQNQKKLDLTKFKYDTDKEYKDSTLKIKQLLANNQINRWQAQTAISEMAEARKAANGGTSGSNKKLTAAGYWNEYYEAMSTPEGKAKIQQIIRQNPSLRKVNQNSVRFIMDRYHGRKSSAKVVSSSSNKSSAKSGSNKTTSSKKKTGVNWK